MLFKKLKLTTETLFLIKFKAKQKLKDIDKAVK